MLHHLNDKRSTNENKCIMIQRKCLNRPNIEKYDHFKLGNQFKQLVYNNFDVKTKLTQKFYINHLLEDTHIVKMGETKEENENTYEFQTRAAESSKLSVTTAELRKHYKFK